jgi:hypothetical protein
LLTKVILPGKTRDAAKTKKKRQELQFLRAWAIAHPLGTFTEASTDINVQGIVLSNLRVLMVHE